MWLHANEQKTESRYCAADFRLSVEGILETAKNFLKTKINLKYRIEPSTIVRTAQGMQKFDFIRNKLWVWRLTKSQHILPEVKYLLDSDWIYEPAASLSEAKTKLDCGRPSKLKMV